MIFDCPSSSCRTEGRTLGPGEIIGRGRGEQVCLAARLGLHLRVHAAAQAERERHLERDDREDEHVGHAEQHATPQGQGSKSSGAASRKPTPRTVCR